jgi:anti-sigma factor RsiW
MTQEQQLKLQAFLDNELSEVEAQEISKWIATDPEAAALHAELKNTRQAMSGFEAGIKLPETREFYWSKIQREINRTEQQQQKQPVQESSPFAWLLRTLMPASAAALVALTALLAIKNLNPGTTIGAPELSTALADSGAFTYRDNQEGMTVVWLSYGEN